MWCEPVRRGQSVSPKARLGWCLTPLGPSLSLLSRFTVGSNVGYNSSLLIDNGKTAQCSRSNAPLAKGLAKCVSCSVYTQTIYVCSVSEPGTEHRFIYCVLGDETKTLRLLCCLRRGQKHVPLWCRCAQGQNTLQ
jgi:hypothetical protein